MMSVFESLFMLLFLGMLSNDELFHGIINGANVLLCIEVACTVITVGGHVTILSTCITDVINGFACSRKAIMILIPILMMFFVESILRLANDLGNMNSSLMRGFLEVLLKGTG